MSVQLLPMVYCSVKKKWACWLQAVGFGALHRILACKSCSFIGCSSLEIQIDSPSETVAWSSAHPRQSSAVTRAPGCNHKHSFANRVLNWGRLLKCTAHNCSIMVTATFTPCHTDLVTGFSSINLASDGPQQSEDTESSLQLEGMGMPRWL